MRLIDIFSVLFVFASYAFGANFETTYFINKRNIENGGPILMGDSDYLYYFTKPCPGSELTMTYVSDGYEWTTVDLLFAKRKYPAFAVYMHQITADGETFAIYSLVLAINGELFQHIPNPPTWKILDEFGGTNRLTFEGSGTFYNYKDRNWYSPSKPSKLYKSPGVWIFNATNDNFIGLTDNALDIEFFPLIDSDKKSDFYERWILLILKECGCIVYYVGELKISKFNKLSGPHEFMQAENVNDIAVADRDRLNVMFNTYLRRSDKDCFSNDWNSLIPQQKQIQLYQTTINNYRLAVKYYFFPSTLSHIYISKINVDVSNVNVLAKYESKIFYMESLFAITPATEAVGFTVRQNPSTNDGIEVGLSLTGRYYYYNKGRNYKNPVGQYCSCGCPVSQNVSMTLNLQKNALRMAILSDGPLIDAYYFANFFFTFFAFCDESNNRMSIYAKGKTTATVSLYIYDAPSVLRRKK